MNISQKILSDITVFNKYAKFVPELGRRENWHELVTRNKEMHIRKYPHLADMIEDAFKFVYDMKVLPSMRSLQFGGRPIELANNRIYNCAFLPIDHPDAFSELMFLLLGGTGGGYSVQYHNIARLPRLRTPTLPARRFIVADSIEGWADAVKVVVEAYFYGKAKPILDFSDIRPKGAALITSGGKAPGPEPLENCIKALCKVFDKALERNGRSSLTSLEVHDMCCIIADAVLAGGIRRAALISLFDRDDVDMLTCKSFYEAQVIEEPMLSIAKVRLKDGTVLSKYVGESKLGDIIELPWYDIAPWRGRANNSAVLPRGRVNYEEFMHLMKAVEESKAGEPGVYWTNDETWGTNPCCEIALRPFQFCNLCEVNVSDVVDQADLEERCKAAAFIGTLQASYTDFHYLRPIWRETTEKDALIGVGMTGIGSGAVLNLDLKKAAMVVRAANAAAAIHLGINASARCTTVKPSGTSSLVLGSSSGVHAWHNDYYIRRMRVGKNEALYEYIAKHLPALVEDDKFSPDTQAVLSFPQAAPEGAILRTESPAQLLERVRKFNVEWVACGHGNGKNRHNVSCTISVKDDEWSEVADWMWTNQNDYNGISVLPYDGGTYVQAPFEDCTKEEYEELMKHMTDIDLTEIKESVDNTDLSGEVACGGGGCEITM